VPRKAKTIEGRTTGDGGRARHVWRIARFGERFEMKDYCRKGGLDWVRMFVTAATNQQSNESTQFLAQLEELDYHYPEQRDAYEGRFWRLCRLTSTQEDWLRGYLLGPGREPIGDAKLAARLHLDLRAMRATLAALRKVGLLEYVLCPDFSQEPQRPQEEPREPREGEPVKKDGKGRGSGKGRKTSPVASVRDDSGKVRKTSEPLYEVTNGNSKSNSHGQMAKGKRKGVSPTQTATAPTTTPPGEANADAAQRIAGRPGPISPQDVTDGGPRHSAAQAERQPATAPLRAHDGPNVVRLGDMMHRAHDGLTHGYTLRADAFAEEIFALLRAPFERDSRDGQRERGNYRAALLDCVDAGMPPGAIEEMMAKGRRDATEIGQHRKRYYRKDGSPEQYWRFRWNQHFRARIPPARAGPEAVLG
jgi:hypothetical protein